MADANNTISMHTYTPLQVMQALVHKTTKEESGWMRGSGSGVCKVMRCVEGSEREVERVRGLLAEMERVSRCRERKGEKE